MDKDFEIWWMRTGITEYHVQIPLEDLQKHVKSLALSAWLACIEEQAEKTRRIL